MKNGILAIALAAGTMLIGVGAAQADFSPPEQTFSFEEGAVVDITFTDDDPTVDSTTYVHTMVGFLTADKLDAKTLRLHGTVPPGVSSGFLSVSSYGGLPGAIRSAAYIFEFTPPPATPVACHVPEGGRFVFRYRNTGVLPC